MRNWVQHNVLRRPGLRSTPCTAAWQSHHAPRWRCRRCVAVVSMAKPWRPTIDDVDSISRGGPAKVRGTGSRRIPHRLNAEERTLYDLAKKKGFLAVRGTAYRKFRHGNPLPNIYRQWCDARGQVCVVVEQDPAGSRSMDRVVVDLAPLRQEDTTQVELMLLELASEAGLRWVGYTERAADALPFNILPPPGLQEASEEHDDDDEEEEEQRLALAGAEREGGRAAAAAASVSNSDSATTSAAAAAAGSSNAVCSNSSSISSSSSNRSSSRSEGHLEVGKDGTVGMASLEESASIRELRRAVDMQAEVVRQLKGQGLTNKDHAVQKQVYVLLQLKANLAQAEAALTSIPQPPQSGEQELLLHCQHQPLAPRNTNIDERTGRGRRREQPTDPTPKDLATPASAPRSPLEHYYRLPIWQIHAVPLFFEGSRTSAKQFASGAVQRVAERV